jgi:predicted ester cyclase
VEGADAFAAIFGAQVHTRLGASAGWCIGGTEAGRSGAVEGNHDPATPPQMRDLRGPEMLKRTVSMYRAEFPDVRITVDDMIAADDKVVLRWHSEGTHRGELAGLAPTGAHGSVTGISIDRWNDGKIVEAWAEWDNLGLARQLGAAPPEGSVGEAIGMGLQRLMGCWMRRKNPR